MRRVDVESQLGPRPQWWALYVIALMLVALVWILEVHVEAGVPRTILEVVVVVSAFAFMRFWMRLNRGAFDLARGRRPD
jgi:hypothetical protein